MTKTPTCTACGYSHAILESLLTADGLCPSCSDQRMYDTALAPLTDKGGAYIVVLASVGNPDFGQHGGRSMPGVPKRRVRVATLRAASEACRLYIRRFELGGGNWAGGDVLDAKTKKVVAQISYNGRAWQPGPYPQPEIALS